MNIFYEYVSIFQEKQEMRNTESVGKDTRVSVKDQQLQFEI